MVEDQFIEAKSFNVILIHAGYSTCFIARSVASALSIRPVHHLAFHISESQILLSIWDNRRGLAVDFDSKVGASLGMLLSHGLNDDPGGSFGIETKKGAHINVILNYKRVITPNVSLS